MKNYNDQLLKGKKVLITGGTKGIGYAVAEAVGASGAELIIVSRNQKDIDTRLRTF